MQAREVDVVIIGAGTAGLNARREVEKAGAHPLLIESGPYGTTCARVGCMPSKLLIAASDVAHEIGDASLFGIEVSDVRIDGVAVLERVRRERDRFAGFVVDSTEAHPRRSGCAVMPDSWAPRRSRWTTTRGWRRSRSSSPRAARR